MTVFQIKLFAENIKETTLGSYFTSVTACLSFVQLRLINCIKY